LYSAVTRFAALQTHFFSAGFSAVETVGVVATHPERMSAEKKSTTILKRFFIEISNLIKVQEEFKRPARDQIATAQINQKI
jgi:hypothetical protein